MNNTQTTEHRTFSTTYGLTLRCYTLDLNSRNEYAYSELRSYIADRTHNMVLLGRFIDSALDQYSEDTSDAMREYDHQQTCREHITAELGQLLASRIERDVRNEMMSTR